MRHSISLFIGSELKNTANETLVYVLKYGANLFFPYFKAYCVEQSDDDLLQITELQKDSLSIMPSTCFSKDEGGSQILQQFFRNLNQRTITIANPGSHNTLHVMLYVQLHNEVAMSHLKRVYEALEKITLPFEIDIVAILPDVTAFGTDVDIATRNKIARESLKYINELSKPFTSKIAHIIAISDTNNNGFSLNLTEKTLNAIVGELTLLCIEHYDSLFPNTVFNNDEKLTAIGLSVCRFDKYYFADYLLGKAYLMLLDNEGVNQGSVSANRCEAISSKIIRPYQKILSKFIGEYCLDADGKTINIKKEIIEENKTEFIDRLNKELQSFITDDALSLPEKQVVQANILGEDDSLVSNNSYNDQQLTFDDITNEPYSFFIKENNSNISVLLEKDNDGKAKEIVGDINGNEKIKLLLPKLKKLKREICNHTQYIRNLSSQLNKIQVVQQQAVNVERRLTKEGYIFEGVTRRLSRINETPLDETYTPHPVADKSIDLRANFSPIKDQGAQGACSAFTVASIYEYILNKGGTDKTDLSEAFLYYNTRKKNGNENEDTGASFYDTIGAISSEGICVQDLCKYDEGVFNVSPSEDAYVDGLTRVVNKAQNVKVSLDDFKSALSDGYPIAISLNVYESFGDTVGGFVKIPTSEEIATSESGKTSHAMVICGYSDEEKVFVVRNSWGTKFGDEGYCYIPYSYVTNPQLCNCACIITEIGAAVSVAGIGTKAVVEFNQMNNDIQRGIALTLIAETTIEVKIKTNEYQNLQTQFVALQQRLQNQNLRDNILQRSKKRIKRELEIETENERRLNQERELLLADLKQYIRAIIFWGLITIGWSVVFYCLYHYNILSGDYALIIGSLGCVAFGIVTFYFWHRFQKEKREIKEQYRVKLGEIEKRRKELKDRENRIVEEFYLAGILFDNLMRIRADFVARYNAMKAYIGNLQVWYKEESENVNKLSPPNNEPIISLATNADLDLYFGSHNQSIIRDLHLHDCFNSNNTINETAIKAFNDSIKQSLNNRLMQIVGGFDMYKYVSGNITFDYLNQACVGIDTLLPKLHSMSIPFCRYQNVGNRNIQNSVITTVFIAIDTTNENDWRNHLRPCFNMPPNDRRISTSDKLIVTQVVPMSFDDVVI